jgi:S-adenosylmethionine:tRNA ribosyltransferase-isomerase
VSELEQYDYRVPSELIAQHPLPRRTDARLLVVDRARCSCAHAHIRDLAELLTAGDCLVLNDSRVIPARLVGYRTETGGRWEGLFLAADPNGTWQVLSKTRGKLKPGSQVTLIDRSARDDVRLRLLMPLEDGRWAARPESGEPALEILQRVGRVPLPFYIRDGQMQESDWDSYQTVFATENGSVAAPTAGLHFTNDLLRRLTTRGIAHVSVTLHVGLGTFRPIGSATLAGHRMHAEWGRISEPAADQLRQTRERGGRIVAVGTTTVRLLETAASQGRLAAWSGQTDLFIYPPYTFRAVDALMTNFHLPRSTLLVLVRTFGGDELVRRAYQEAIQHGYRFFSYGDAMLIL